MQKLTVEFRAVVRDPDTGMYRQSAGFEITAPPDFLKTLDLGNVLNKVFHKVILKDDLQENGSRIMTKAETAEFIKEMEQWDKNHNADS